ncbi:MAG TPA: chemotaxis protein CheX [Steroidobacteraceae bacterium]|nr:chemotaxis protein CheX [Steroidobacteraceae bacterium]
MKTDFSMNATPVSKVLVLDDCQQHLPEIKRFCQQHNLVPLKVRRGTVMSVLRTNIDLGGILCFEGYAGTAEQTAQVAAEIHAARPELPIILRRSAQATLADLPEAARRTFCAAYVASDMGKLGAVIGEYIFCLLYPNALLRGITEITESVLRSQCRPLTVTMETPYIVRDRVIFGELFSLIPLESSWCRGYMMLQTQEAPFVTLLTRQRSAEAHIGFRNVNDLLSEITNLIWGGFKNRYMGDDGSRGVKQVQVPLIVNHEHKYISFGTENPQLCFRFELTDPADGGAVTVYVRFVFNLNWAPEEFREIQQEAARLVDSGALELF